MQYDYNPKNNLFYLSNPWAILALAGSWVFIALLFNHPLYIIAIFLIISSIIIASGNFKPWQAGLKFFLPLIIIIVLINSLFNGNGSTSLAVFSIYKSYSLNINLEGLIYGLIAGLKLLVIITSFSFASLVIDPDKLLSLTRRFGYQISLIINLSARLFPLVISDYRRIHEIQRYRSLPAAQEKTTLFNRINSYVPTLSILLVNSLDRSLKTAESLYSRGYGSGTPTVYNRNVWQFTDYMILGHSLITIILALGLHIKGWSFYEYYPYLSGFSPAGIISAWFLSIMLGLPLLLNWSNKLWRKSQ